MASALSRPMTIAFAASLLVGALGFAHTRTGAALVSGVNRMVHGHCPFGYDQAMSPAERERARARFAVLHRAERRATNRPALGFTLDQTTRPEVVAQLASQGVHCVPGQGMSDLTCQHVPSAALPGGALPAPERTLWFTFGTKAQLLSVVAVSQAPSAQVISDAFVGTGNALKDHAGSATTRSGGADPQTLSQGLLRQASAEFEFSNYYAVERAANMGKSYVFTEEYRSLPD